MEVGGTFRFFGQFFPMFLFAFAETEIDSSVAAILNSLVPLFTLFLGLVVFGVRFLKINCLVFFWVF